MGIIFSPGTIEEALEVESGIPEFGASQSRNVYEQRLLDRPHLILIARDVEKPVAYKVGYEEDEQTFYSWLGGVLPGYRRVGLAQQLLELQEAWVEHAGYKRITVKSRNRFSGMLILLIRNGYQIQEVERAEKLDSYRIHLVKELK